MVKTIKSPNRYKTRNNQMNPFPKSSPQLKEKIEHLEHQLDAERARVRKLQERLAPLLGLSFYDCECGECDVRNSSIEFS